MPEWMPISKKANEAVKQKEQAARRENPCQGGLLFFFIIVAMKPRPLDRKRTPKQRPCPLPRPMR